MRCGCFCLSLMAYNDIALHTSSVDSYALTFGTSLDFLAAVASIKILMEQKLLMLLK